ncbi:hypothetical protein GLOTRDRAFT_112750 [Gloeophyllum trabeum ATCC 11539]|uniref:CREG-like beta-barrel domain-containing protein n=1 Tax=Gloeophyllum trabeum (strain ATCC 11539 / FP-39264 / Madison 617) TaxID=670483 RepID=S7PS87_GLOTA|nr:uncharacterized protein GLOTRDRAFT_112750 [Gloeophyllum trabeum ATCC 11539]EPQ50258.1 hypothetical protein GLOTRDRAFT_112750 [Gloeophyllum trabeum ATCC 11539]
MTLSVRSVLFLVALVASCTLSTSLTPQSIFSPLDANTIGGDTAPLRIPTVHESAVQGRRIMHLTTIGTLSTVFPSSEPSATPLESRPAGLEGAPIGLMDYFADCEPAAGNPTILAVDIATSFKNARAGSNVTLSMRWVPPDAHVRSYSPAALPRFSLVGYLEDLSDEDVEKGGVASCFVRHHRDARLWLPGNRIHESRWVRLVVNGVYWIGGFGDRAYIGWIPVDVWKNVTAEEVEQCRLPGEKTGVLSTLVDWLGLSWGLW